MLYGHVIANLGNDYTKGNNHYPKNMPNAYKYLSEYNTGSSGIESYSRPSNHLAFMQGNPKGSGKACYKCDNPGYTVRTCLVFNSKRESKPSQGAFKKKECSPKPQKSKTVSFATTVKKLSKPKVV